MTYTKKTEKNKLLREVNTRYLARKILTLLAIILLIIVVAFFIACLIVSSKKYEQLKNEGLLTEQEIYEYLSSKWYSLVKVISTEDDKIKLGFSNTSIGLLCAFGAAVLLGIGAIIMVFMMKSPRSVKEIIADKPSLLTAVEDDNKNK